MQTTAIGTVAKSLPENEVILLTLLISKRYIPYTDLRKSRIYLPATETGEIDFAFMSSFMKEVEQDILKTTLKFFKDRHIVNNSKMGGGEMETLPHP